MREKEETMMLFKNKGQGTTEYLIILAIVIVIALVVVGVLGGFPSLGSGVSQGQSKAYWGSTTPLALIEWSVSASTGTLVFQNQTSGTITITDVNWGGANVNIADTSISAGGKSNITHADFTCGVTAGQSFSKTMAYKYNTANLTGLWFTGVTAVAGSCQ